MGSDVNMKWQGPVQRPPVKGVLLDVNETLFSLDKLGPAFAASGLDPTLASLWFAQVLCEGFALAAAGDYCGFADIAVATLWRLRPQGLTPAAAQGGAAFTCWSLILTAWAGADARRAQPLHDPYGERCHTRRGAICA
jgi:hypothetical protein